MRFSCQNVHLDFIRTVWLSFFVEDFPFPSSGLSSGVKVSCFSSRDHSLGSYVLPKHAIRSCLPEFLSEFLVLSGGWIQGFSILYAKRFSFS